jgi:hypothetical protein
MCTSLSGTTNLTGLALLPILMLFDGSRERNSCGAVDACGGELGCGGRDCHYELTIGYCRH